LNIDRERQRIGLSIKALTPDPWEIAPTKYAHDILVEGKVSQVVDFGIFVELEPGVEGLLHNSELRDPSQRDELEPGQRVLVKVIRVEPERRRIGLSVRQVRPDEWEEWAMAQAEAQAAAELARAQAEAEPAVELGEDAESEYDDEEDEFGLDDSGDAEAVDDSSDTEAVDGELSAEE